MDDPHDEHEKGWPDRRHFEDWIDDEKRKDSGSGVIVVLAICFIVAVFGLGWAFAELVF